MSRLAIVPILRFDIFWGIEEDGQGARAGLHEDRTRKWVGAAPSVKDAPPDQMMEYILSAIEPLDLHLGTALHAVQADPELEERMGMRMLKRLTARLIGERMKRTDLPRLLSEEIADSLLVDLPKKKLKAIALKLTRGMCQLLLRERAIRTRTILEVHAMQSLRSAANVDGLDRLMGKQLAIAVVYEAPDQEVQVAESDEVHSDSPQP